MIDLRGAWTALVTPFTTGGERIDESRLTMNVAEQARAGMRGVVPCGTTGETPTLQPDEYRRVVELTLQAAAATNLAVMVGAGSNCTSHAVAQHRFAADAGADAALHVTPYYNKPSPEGLYRHFMTIADASDLPVVLYNVPGRTNVRLTTGTIVRLAAHPNIRGLKDATGGLDQAAEVANGTGLTVLSGDDPLTLPMAMVGGSGVISVIGNLLPERVAGLWGAIDDGRYDDARRLHAELLPVARALLQLDVNPVPVKTALQLAGQDTGAVRLPLVASEASVVEQLTAVLETCGVLGAPLGS